MAAVSPGKHHGGQDAAADRAGLHRADRANGVSVAALLERVSRAGLAIRLAWRGTERTDVVQHSDEFPTGVLPVIRDRFPGAVSDDEETEPTSATREAWRWLRPEHFSWWPTVLAG